MNPTFHELYKNYTTVDLLKITLRPDSYQSAAVIEATEILKTRVVTQADINEAEEAVKEKEPAAPLNGLLEKILKAGSYTLQNWLNIILAVFILDYIHLLYIDIRLISYVFSNQYVPFKFVSLGSYLDLLFLPFVYYLFYKRKRWGWIVLFGVKLFTIEPSLLFYFREVLPYETGIRLVPYTILMNLIQAIIVVFLWKRDVRRIFNVDEKTKWLTVSIVVFLLVLLTIIGEYNRTSYAEVKSNIQTQTTAPSVDSSTGPTPKLLTLIKANREKPLDTTYMPTGFYFLAEDGKGISMREEKTYNVYTISRMPFASIKNLIKAELQTSHSNNGDNTDLCITFDSKGTKDLAAGTGNPKHPQIAVVVANRLLYVLENSNSIKGGGMCIALIGYSEPEMKKMLDAVNAKK